MYYTSRPIELFRNERQKRNILGGNAARLFNLNDPYRANAAAE